MKTYLYPLLAGLLSLAACTNDTLQEIVPLDPAEEDNKVNQAEGTFIVDYSVDGDAATRAAGDSKLQIRSLDYYVYYEAGGELVKHRRIMIDPNTQKWPMTRENMTWEQRQFLQDTLQYDVAYRTLFIANVDSSLFNYDTYSEANPHPAVVTGDTLYQNARILLPNVPFHEDNYYCLWEGRLNNSSNDEAGRKELIKRNDVLLQRIVTRTDISRVETPTTIDALVKSIYEQLCDTPIEEQVAKHIDEFCRILEDESTKGTYFSNYLKPYGSEGEYDYVGELVTYLKDHIKIIQTNVKNKIIEQYNSIYTNAIQNKYMIRTEWNAVTYVKCNYKESTRMEAMGFDLTPYVGENTHPNIPINAFQFSIVGFAGSENSNVINSIDFYSSASPDSPIFIINETPLTYTSINTQEKNRLYNVICDPVNKIEETKAEVEKTWDGINIDELFNEDDNWNTLYATDLTNLLNYIYDSFKGAIGRRVFEDHKEFGKSLENFSFPISIPNIQSDADFRFIPSWDMNIAE